MINNYLDFDHMYQEVENLKAEYIIQDIKDFDFLNFIENEDYIRRTLDRRKLVIYRYYIEELLCIKTYMQNAYKDLNRYKEVMQDEEVTMKIDKYFLKLKLEEEMNNDNVQRNRRKI